MTEPAPFVPHMSPTVLIDLALLTMMAVCAIAMINMRRLFGVVMISGIYSLLSALFFVLMDAVDVAFTEAAVGAGVSTVLMLSGMALSSRREAPLRPSRSVVPAIVSLIVGGALMYATLDMPAFGDANAPANAYVGQLYVERMPYEIGVPNIVTGTLADYRGYDTMGETLVVFTAGLACVLLLGAGSLRGGRRVSDSAPADPAFDDQTPGAAP